MSFIKNSRTMHRMPIDALRLASLPMQQNPNKQIEKAKRFLAEFDQIPLIYADPHGEILFGEEIWLALRELGAAEVDVIVIDGKSPAELKAIRLALHRIPGDARWIDHNVQAVLQELEAVGMDLDLTGFDAPEIDSYLNLDVPKATFEDSRNEIPPIEKHAVCRLGSIWKLGPHRLGCGSATDLQFVRAVLQQQPASMGFIDPGHDIPLGFISGKGRNGHPEFGQASSELADDQYFLLLRQAFAVLQNLSASDALIFACIDWRHVMEMTVAGHACDMPLYNLCVWTKPSGAISGIYRDAYELVCVFGAGAEPPSVNVGRHRPNRANVWSHPARSPRGKGAEEALGSQPTGKPVVMIADALREVTTRGAVVLDTFLGCGSTLMAAQQTGRICCGVELVPCYLDAAIRRWQNATGRDAILLETGERFNALSQRLLIAPTERTNGL